MQFDGSEKHAKPASIMQWSLQPSVAERLPSSHASPGSIFPLPHADGARRRTGRETRYPSVSAAVDDPLASSVESAANPPAKTVITWPSYLASSTIATGTSRTSGEVALLAVTVKSDSLNEALPSLSVPRT